MDALPVMSEFPDVFPDDVPGLPSKRETQFTIDLIPRIGLISTTPYRMSPAEFAELKKQLDDMLKKEFITSSVSPWGAPIFFVKKNDIRGCVWTIDNFTELL